MSVAIARSCIRGGARVRFYNTTDLVKRLELEAHQDRAGKLAKHLSRLDLLVLDELGYLPFARTGGKLLFHLISWLYERTSVIVTTNLAFGEWPTVSATPRCRPRCSTGSPITATSSRPAMKADGSCRSPLPSRLTAD